MIQVNNVSFHYRKNQSLIKHLDLELNKGSIYGLLGLNGSGKTTLLKLMTGMLFPQEGEVTLSNLNVKSRTPNLNSRLFFIPDVLQLPPIKGRSFIRDYSVFYPKFDQEAMGLGLELFNVSANSNLKDLSHGAKKKFLIAFALATNTEYLIMDEPTNGLDIPSKSSFRKLLASSISDEKLFLISSHQINDLNNIIDPIIVLYNGEIVFNYSIENILSALRFQSSESLPDQEQILYHESKMGTYKYIYKNHYPDSLDLDVDMEFLFNGIIANHKKINQHLNNL